MLDPASITNNLFLDSSILRRHVPVFSQAHLSELEDDQTVRGIRYLVVLEKGDGRAEPVLSRWALSTPVAQTRASSNDTSIKDSDTKVKTEPPGVEDPLEAALPDTARGYEAFLRIVSRLFTTRVD